MEIFRKRCTVANCKSTRELQRITDIYNEYNSTDPDYSNVERMAECLGKIAAHLIDR